MRRITSLLCTVLALFLAGLVGAYAGEHHQSAPYTGSAEFERMKQLVGVWTGTSDMGKPEEKVTVGYRLTAGGSALVETLFPGSSEEMVSVYTDRNGTLAMTHYCMLRNQPRMKLANADARSLELIFDPKGNDIDPAVEKHMHGVRFTFKDNDHIVQKWTLYDKGKDVGGVTLQLTRAR
jgi:hypothetical protein